MQALAGELRDHARILIVAAISFGGSKMKTKLIGAALALLLTSGAAMADAAADQDATPVTKCESLPPSVSISVVSWADTRKICNEMTRVMEGFRYKDITSFEKAVFVLSMACDSSDCKGLSSTSYGKDKIQITKELIEIIRLRGLFNKPDRWSDNDELIVKAWNAFNGAVGPDKIIVNLRAAGPDAAKALSDDGLITMIVLIKRLHQSGDE
jgi:hypothetical protein